MRLTTETQTEKLIEARIMYTDLRTAIVTYLDWQNVPCYACIAGEDTSCICNEQTEAYEQLMTVLESGQ